MRVKVGNWELEIIDDEVYTFCHNCGRKIKIDPANVTISDLICTQPFCSDDCYEEFREEIGPTYACIF